MSFFYKSQRIGKNGRPFTMWKVRTLKDGADRGHFAKEYTLCGRFLRRFKLDELPQIFNILKGDMSIVGPRPMEKRTIDVIPEETRNVILSTKPGLTDLASIFFFDEERILANSADKTTDYWTKIQPIKFALQSFYVENKCLSLDLWICWQTFKRIVKEFFK